MKNKLKMMCLLFATYVFASIFGCSDVSDTETSVYTETWLKSENNHPFKKIYWENEGRDRKLEEVIYFKDGEVHHYFDSNGNKIRVEMKLLSDSSWYEMKYDQEGEILQQSFYSPVDKDTSYIEHLTKKLDVNTNFHYVMKGDDTLNVFIETDEQSSSIIYEVISQKKRISSKEYFKGERTVLMVDYSYRDNFVIVDSTLFEYLNDSGSDLKLSSIFINDELSEKWIYSYDSAGRLIEVVNWTPYSEEKYIVKYD